MDTIFLHELKAETLIGVYEWERRVRQTVQVDLEIALPDSRACKTDNFSDALDYGQIVRRVQDTLANKHFSLLEALAEHIAQMIIEDFGSPWVRVSIAKLAMIRGVKQIGVSVERGKGNTYPRG